MTVKELRDMIRRLLQHVAPEADASAIDPKEPLQQALDLDSFDFLRFLVSVREETGVTIEESDYGNLRTVDDLVRFLEPRLGAK